MRKAYIIMAVLTYIVAWILLSLLLPWWLATIVMLGVAWLFWKEVTPMLRYWRPHRRTGWQRNALRWTRRDLPDPETEAPELSQYRRRER
jgi:predicted DNA repair protein MutK